MNFWMYTRSIYDTIRYKWICIFKHSLYFVVFGIFWIVFFFLFFVFIFTFHVDAMKRSFVSIFGLDWKWNVIQRSDIRKRMVKWTLIEIKEFPLGNIISNFPLEPKNRWKSGRKDAKVKTNEKFFLFFFLSECLLCILKIHCNHIEQLQSVWLTLYVWNQLNWITMHPHELEKYQHDKSVKRFSCFLHIERIKRS